MTIHLDHTPRVAVFLMHGFEQMEALVPMDLWARAGFKVDTISLEPTHEVVSLHQVRVLADYTLEQAGQSFHWTDFDVIFLPGGAIDLNKYVALEPVLKSHLERNNTLLSAICAAPAALATLGLLTDKEATCYPTMSEELTKHGVTYKDQKVVELDRIITGQAPGASFELGFAVIKKLTSIAVTETVRRETVH